MTTIDNFIPEDVSTLFAAFAAAYGVGLLSMLVSPFLIGSMVDELNLTNSQAGMVGTLEFVGVMIGNFAVASSIGRLPRAKIAILGAIVVILGNIICLLWGQFEFLLVIRTVIGLGAGLALASGNATVANAQDPEKMASQMSFLFVVLMIITTYIFSFAIREWGYQGACAAIALLTLVMLTLITRLPQRSQHIIYSSQEPIAKKNAIFSLLGMLMLFGAFLFSWRDMMHWSFVERVGVAAGYSNHEIGRLLSIQAFIGLLGPLLALMASRKFGLRIPVLLGVITTGVVTYLVIGSASNRSIYPLAVMGIAITYFFVLPYLTAMAADLDQEGRIAAALGGFMIAGAAIAPVTTGYMIDNIGYSAIGWVVISVVLLTTIFIGVPLFKLDQTSSSK